MTNLTAVNQVTVTELASSTRAYLETNINSVDRLSISKVRKSSGGAFYITVIDKDAPKDSSATNIWFSKGFSEKTGMVEGDTPSFLKDSRVCKVGEYVKICALSNSENYDNASDLF